MQVRKLRADEWQERHIHRPYLAFDSILSEALQHNLPAILPPPHAGGGGASASASGAGGAASAGGNGDDAAAVGVGGAAAAGSVQYPLPWVVFRMFDYTDCPEVNQRNRISLMIMT